MDESILLWIHGHATPSLDAVFRFSDLIGTWQFCGALVAVMIAWCLLRSERRSAAAWAVVGALTGIVPELIKLAVGRQRPALWPHLVEVSSAAFPSGHATAGMALYPFLGWMLLRGHPLARRVGCAVGMAVGGFIGVGRLYLGVHWPSDVLAGWVLGLALSAGTLAWLERGRVSAPEAGEV